MKILITGGMGFIFSHVTEHFLEKGYEVHVFDNMSSGSHPELLPVFKQNPSFHFHKVDVSSQEVPELIRSIKPEYIIHAAAISDVDYSIREPFMTQYRNHRATMNVFEAARLMPTLKKLLYVSTDEVYGECDHPKEEDEIIFPRNPYSLSKAMGSLLRLAYDNTYEDLRDKTCETRFCNVFGPRQDDRKIIPAIIRAITGGAPVALHNGGHGFRQYIHVGEIPPLIELLLAKGTRTYNVTAGEGYTVNELLSLTERLTDRRVPTVEAKRPGMDVRYEMSSARLISEFNWKPQAKFEESFFHYLNENIHGKAGHL